MARETNRAPEKTLSVLPAQLKTGLFAVQDYALVLTAERMILVRLTSEMLGAAAQEAADGARDAGKGFWAQAAASMGSVGALLRRLQEMPPDEILREYGDSWSASNSAISAITYRRGRGDSDEARPDPDQLIVDASGATRKLLLRNVQQPVQLLALLKGLFGDRLRKR